MNIVRIPTGPLQAICYLLSDSHGQTIIIDPGAEPNKIISRISANKLLPQCILLTHGHYDHLEAVNDLRNHYAIKSSLHPADLPMQEQGFWEHYLGRTFTAPIIDEALHDKQEIECGSITINVIETPGHSPGSVSFYCEQEKILISGDTLFADGDIGRTDLWESSSKAIIESITHKLFSLPAETLVYPGHGNSSTIGQEKAIHLNSRG